VFLKRAILHGFKSFADRTEFDFGPGVTSIVGPNGCGKSNLLDAVRWVLGEQSAKSLRGDRMLDVIFSGSRTRKPANFAEVSLVFDNSRGILRSDLPEVAVGRVLYRSGESEYRLNGAACRLKDIRELLLDTGVGVDAYSVIEQGRVDQLLQASPIERREIFEEAAGISRYKLRRIEAQRKLERTRENLARLQDIIDEIERRLRSVKLAAGKARSFLELDAKLREKRSSFALAEYHELETRRGGAQAECDTLLEAIHASRAALAEHDAAAVELSQSLQNQDDRIQSADASLNVDRSRLGALEERVVQSRRRVGELQASLQRARDRAIEHASQKTALEERSASMLTALQSAIEIECAAEARLGELREVRESVERRLADARRELDEQRTAAFEAARRSSLIQSELTQLETQAQRLSAALARLTSRRSEIDHEQAVVEGRAAGLREQGSALGLRQTELSTQLHADDKRAEALNAEAAQLDAEISSGKESRSAIISRLSLLEDMELRLEGVDAGTRAVLGWRSEAAPEAGGVLGLVADLVRIDDPRVGVLQPVLATFETHVVVRGMTAFVDECRQRGLPDGSLRVVALDRLRDKPIATGYESTPGFIARAADWALCRDEIRPLADQLLARVIIVDTFARALRLAEEALAGYVFVSLDGWCVHADGRVARGVASAADGLISRKAEIRQLHSRQDEVEHGLALATRRRLEVERVQSDLLLRREATLQEIARVQRQDAELRGELARVGDEQQRLERETRLLDGELGQTRRQIDELQAQAGRLRDESASSSDELRGREQSVDQLAQDLLAFEAEVARVRQEILAAEVEKGRATERRGAAEHVSADTVARVRALADEAERIAAEAEDARVQIVASEAEIQAAELEQAALRDHIRVREDGLIAMRVERQQIKGEIETCGAEARELQKRIEAGESALHEKQMAIRELEVKRDALAGRIKEELDIDLAERHAGYQHAAQDWEAVRAEIGELRAKIQRLGNVNLDAIQELEELTPRYDHLTSQRADLQDAVLRLEALIAELDAESKARFSGAFAQIQINFQDLFRKLFGGGKADIVLENPEQPLECGIEIIARPPGKEPQSISLLSGGERTMTAVALLLAVFRSRPSPFAILDEVDAALDEANTDRFNRVLQEFLSQSQFVVITHSKRTMAGADVLYGVTMEEPGVSKRVSVRFEERLSTPVGA
jgi:chromosome segregation protein